MKRSKGYNNALALLDGTKRYSASEACELV